MTPENDKAPFGGPFKTTALPAQAGKVVDIAAIEGTGRSSWSLLAEDDRLFRLDADTLDCACVGSSSVPVEKGKSGVKPRRHLHVSPLGELAAVVNDRGQYGQIIDLQTGKVTQALDGGDYHNDLVRFSFAFAEANGRALAIHRTAWNRLDVSDARSGELLTERSSPKYRHGERLPEHYLDYFHGALHISPDGTQILDDGWRWQPEGIPVVWDLAPWISENVWESEDGKTRQRLCARESWDTAITWIDERRAVVGSTGEDQVEGIDGVRIFDTKSEVSRFSNEWPRELKSFPGPVGRFFSDGAWLYSADATGLSRWDFEAGVRNGFLPGFRPKHHHRRARELVQLIDGALVRLDIS